MANTRRPNATYIPLTGVGVGVGANANLRVCVGSKIPTCWYPLHKILASGALPNTNPNARYFALQWNIGLSLIYITSVQNTITFHRIDIFVYGLYFLDLQDIS